MNELARELVRDLRSGKLDSEFDMRTWGSPCGTVGCIAGHALMRTNHRFFRESIDEFVAIPLDGGRAIHLNGLSITTEAVDALGIANFQAAQHLFLPNKWHVSLVHHRFALYYSQTWTDNYRCDLDTIEKMREWAASRSVTRIYDQIGPREAANALEWVANDEPYTDWMTAIEKENA